MSNDFIPASELILNPDGSIYHLHLKPGDVATKIITVGDQNRVAQVARHFTSIEIERQHREFKTVTGQYKGERLTVISTGISTDNIDIVLHELDALFQFDFTTRTRKAEHITLQIARIGTSGAMRADIAMNSMLISTKALAFDSLLHFYAHGEFATPNDWPEHLNAIKPLITEADARLLQSAPKDMLRGITATMPGFYAPQGRAFRLKSVFNETLSDLQNLRINDEGISNIEMETAGIYGLSTLLGHEAISFNAILANRITGEFSADPQKIVDELIDKVLDWFVTV